MRKSNVMVIKALTTRMVMLLTYQLETMYEDEELVRSIDIPSQ